MAAERPVCDQAVRDLVAGDLTTTYLVEASAGTGKTRVLVDRYVHCVLDPQLGSRDVRTVAAITFTEKAAGELRQRIRERFEELAERVADAENAGGGGGAAAAIDRALDALDDAPISTIHGFAGRLLREYAVEAAIDPAFEQLDQLSGELERGRLWDEWLIELAAAKPGTADAFSRVRGWLGDLLAMGVRLAAIRELAVGGVFGERYDLDPALPPPLAPNLITRMRALDEGKRALRDFCDAACTDHADKGFCSALALVEALDECGAWLDEAEGSCSLEEQVARLHALPLKTGSTGPGGAKTAWSAAQGGKDELVHRYTALVRDVVALRDEHAAYVAALAVAVADAFARWAGAAQLGLGRLDFTDLLGQLRDLLARNVAARGELQRRFRYVLVDEFQDTDPLQAESVLLLCEREPRAVGWRDVELTPGKLFVVGDPKQSIYRFRRADIALYDDVKALIQAQPEGKGRVVAIEQNFRTTPALVAWVNNVFAGVFEDDAEVGRQPEYQWAEPYRPPAEGPRVAVLLGRQYGRQGEADQLQRDEARALAALLRDIHDHTGGVWDVCERGRGGPSEPTRPAGWGDIALLVRTTTALESYEQALREAGVPYRVEGGKTYFARREVDDVLVCLRAVDDPTDGPAVYAALHSSLFGFSDDELVLFWTAGGRFEPFGPQGDDGPPTGHEAIVAALATLRRLHELRGQGEVHELVEEFLRVTCSRELQAATGDGAAQALANLEKLVERAQAFAHAGGGGLGAFLRWAAEAGDAAGEQESLVDDEGDVVHILTIHKAKGLEYPIVVLAGGASGSIGGRGGDWRRGGGAEALVDRHGRCLQAKLKADLPGATCTLVPPAFTELAEREKVMARSEARRLLYVAATRARDRLVISLFGALQTAKGEAAQVLLGPLAACLPEPGSVAESGERDGLLVLVPGEPAARPLREIPADVAALLAERARWSDERTSVLERAAEPVAATSPSALEHVDEVVAAGGPGAPPGRAGALALGSTVHRVMELCDLDDEAALAPLAAAAAAECGRPDLAGDAMTLARACWRAAVVRAAARSPEVHRELPVGAYLAGVIVSGAVDLLFLDGDEWVVVDYKTDREATAEALRGRYEPQGAAYTLVLEAATGRRVREVVLVAAASGLEVHIPVDDALRDRAREAIAAAGGRGEPLVALHDVAD